MKISSLKSSKLKGTNQLNICSTSEHERYLSKSSGAIPLEIHFKSSSSRIRVHQTHQAGGAGEVEQTSSEEEPHRLVRI